MVYSESFEVRIIKIFVLLVFKNFVFKLSKNALTSAVAQQHVAVGPKHVLIHVLMAALEMMAVLLNKLKILKLATFKIAQV